MANLTMLLSFFFKKLYDHYSIYFSRSHMSGSRKSKMVDVKSEVRKFISACRHERIKITNAPCFEERQPHYIFVIEFGKLTFHCGSAAKFPMQTFRKVWKFSTQPSMQTSEPSRRL